MAGPSVVRTNKRVKNIVKVKSKLSTYFNLRDAIHLLMLITFNIWCLIPGAFSTCPFACTVISTRVETADDSTLVEEFQEGFVFEWGPFLRYGFSFKHPRKGHHNHRCQHTARLVVNVIGQNRGCECNSVGIYIKVHKIPSLTFERYQALHRQHQCRWLKNEEQNSVLVLSPDSSTPRKWKC